MTVVKIVMISDTHCQTDKIKDMPSGDILLHAGDMTYHGEYHKLDAFNDWLDEQYFSHKVIIPGNHDKTFERNWDEAASHVPAADVILNQALYEAEGLKIWGEPRQPWFHDWAFNVERGDMKRLVWDKVPENIDVLLTHGPPYGVLDRTRTGEHVGCTAQRDWIIKHQPRLVVCGHIHEDPGLAMIGRTLVVNAAICDLQYNVVNRPVVLALDV